MGRYEFKLGGINTNSKCNLSCVMCEFHGPSGGQVGREESSELSEQQVLKFLREIPAAQDLWFASFGEIFLDSLALTHIRNAVALGHIPHVLTNAQLLDEGLIDELLAIGVRYFSFSVDAIDHRTYAKVRRKGDFQKILDAATILNSRRTAFPDIHLTIGNVILGNMTDEDVFVRFWTGKADFIAFFHQVHEFGLKFKSTYYFPKERNECDIHAYLLPNGQVSPCCTINTHSNYFDLDWLPNIDEMTAQEAYDQLQDMYHDPSSPLREICGRCEQWIRFHKPNDGNFPHIRSFNLGSPAIREEPVQPLAPSKVPEWMKALSKLFK